MKFSLNLILLLFLFTAKCYSQPIFNYSPADEIKEIKGLYYYKTSDTTLDIHQVINKKFTLRKNNNIGITNDVIWVCIGIRNNAPQESIYLEVSNPLLEKVNFYTYRNNRVTDSLELGRYTSFYSRIGAFVNYVYPLHLDSTLSLIFIKVKTSTPTHLPLFISTKSTLINKSFNDTLLFGIYIGVILIMVIYHLFLNFIIKDNSYRYYIIYIISVGFAQIVLKGYAFKYLWPDNVWLSINSLNLSGILSGVTTLIFTKVFLQTKKNTPLLNRAINTAIGIYIIILFIHFFISKYIAFNAINIAAFLGSLIVVYTAYIAIQKRFKPAKYFLLGFSVFLTSVIIYVLHSSGFIGYNVFTSYTLEIGSAIQIALLSFALADKINTYRKEEAAARREALIASKENERLVKEQNIILEKEVKARTFDLQKANEDLSETLVQLKTTQTKLVESEKMISLGQLTAGVAHEINNPINFVASNVKPLELDIQDIFDVLKKYETINLSTDVHNQIQEIEDYKKQIDVDYIEKEIKSLLEGIKEGALRTSEIVKNLKNFVRLDQSNLKFADLNEGIDSTILLVRNTFPNNLVVDKNLGKINLVECAPGKINQVFMNIVTNAIQAIKAKKYTQDETPTLTIDSKQDGKNVKISIRDNGIGMSHEVLNKIYEPFFTTKDVGEGTGLGMSIVKGIIESHNGELEVFSEPDIGTEFIITLPERSTIQ